MNAVSLIPVQAVQAQRQPTQQNDKHEQQHALLWAADRVNLDVSCAKHLDILSQYLISVKALGIAWAHGQFPGLLFQCMHGIL